MKALLYLNVHLLKNSILQFLKNPKIVVPGVFMAVLFSIPLIVLYTFELPQFPFPYTTETVKPILFSFFSFITWVTIIHSTTKSTLVFSLSEIDFLFPSPLTRKIILLNRLLINYLKIGGQYLALGGVMLFIFSSLFDFAFWPRILFLWVALVLIMIFASNIGDLISLMSSHYSELSRKRNRRIIVMGAVVLVGGIFFYVYWLTSQGIPLINAVLQALNSSIVRAVMYPMAAAADIAVAWHFTSLLGIKILFLTLLCIGTIIGVLSVETHFYEASETTSREIWQSVQKMRQQDVVVSESFIKKIQKMRTIKPFGTKATALIWKNLVGLLRDVRTLIPTVTMAAIFFVIMVVRGGEFYSAVFLLFFMVFITSGYIRWDFRQDLRRIEIIKLVPDSNFKIVVSEIAVPCIVSTLISYCFLIVTYCMFPSVEFKVLLTVFSLVGIPLFSVIMVSILNLSALYYPPHTTNQAIPGILSMVGMMIVITPSILLGMIFLTLNLVYAGLAAVLLVNVVTAVVILKILARKYRTFDSTTA
jgi:hypothetical protein